MTLLRNTSSDFGSPLSGREREYLGTRAPAGVAPFLALWGEVEKTPLIPLPEVAARLGLGTVALKNEAFRLGQGSFKALGGAYAVMVLFKRLLEKHLGREVRVTQLLSPTAREFASTVTVCCATDGNHGKSVAAGARLLGCRSVIFIHAGVTQARAKGLGADEVVRVDGNYDLSVSEAERVSAERGWLLVSDTSWEGYEEIPAIVGQGYTILAQEALEQLHDRQFPLPTHVFLQAGVGGFAASIAGYLRERLGREVTVVVVEPDRAACLHESARAGELTSVPSIEPTIMAMLECFTPSLIAWRTLKKVADGFMTIREGDAENAMRLLANRNVVAGESGAAGLAGLLVAGADTTMKAALGLGPTSHVLLINTETATDPASFKAIVGMDPALIERPDEVASSA
ncbi:diaminopropionate ammonia-lyase [Aquamicrobium sp. LC103]|uniref:diaminopropionate ammonia-lyase n=1 Tax=Aquamicrobium sp. LC103 TaxID=1120658 RepID=UPI00063E76C6|nr:diaminopropionate ammonia-lyase [Aquamicrobium sp. LC103]TKT69424.1 diaminopropionate ammonia-lyase [Aquamicrobium sp. LC103]